MARAAQLAAFAVSAAVALWTVPLAAEPAANGRQTQPAANGRQAEPAANGRLVGNGQSTLLRNCNG